MVITIISFIFNFLLLAAIIITFLLSQRDRADEHTQIYSVAYKTYRLSLKEGCGSCRIVEDANVCSYCNGMLFCKNTYCCHCGRKVEFVQEKVCTRCKAHYSMEKEYCPFCGQKAWMNFSILEGFTLYTQGKSNEQRTYVSDETDGIREDSTNDYSS